MIAGQAFRVHQLAYEHRSRGTLLGSIALFVMAVGLCAPRTFGFSFLLLPAAFVATRLIARDRPVRDRPVCDRRGAAWSASADAASAGARQAARLAAVTFFAWAALSALWSVAPAMSLVKALVAAAIALSVVLTLDTAFTLSDGDASRLGEGVWMAVLAATAFLLFEIFSERLLLRTVVNTFGVSPGSLNPTIFFTWQGARLVGVQIDDMNRQVVSLAFMLPAGLLAARVTVQPWARLLSIVMAGGGAVAILCSGSETAKLALVTAGIAWGLAVVSRKAAFALLAAGWIGATLLIVPALQMAHATGLDASPVVAKALQRGSASERFKILNAFVARIGEAPLIGHGANAAYVLGPQEVEQADGRQRDGKAALAQHPHNAYLQIWFDLGAIGAALLAVLGLAMLTAVRRLRDDEQPLAYATFAAGAAILAPSYGIWQYWYMAMFGVGVIALGLAVRASRACRPPASAPL